MGMERNKTGLAGELRVMSELLLRGHNPAKSYLESGADIVLENGKRIEVKSSHRQYFQKRWSYYFTLKGSGRNQPQDLENCDFVICWCINDDCFFIIPKEIITGYSVCISNSPPSSHSKYIKYKDSWGLLIGEEV